MTARTYENLPTLIGELKRSAIDAYMKSQGWHIDDGVKYHLGDNNVTRPGADGQGGGDWSWIGVLGHRQRRPGREVDGRLRHHPLQHRRDTEAMARPA